MKYLWMMLMVSNIVWAETVVINGKSYKCDGSVSVINNSATCNGKPMTDDDGSSSGPCVGSTVKPHSNGGGQVDILASVSKSANIKGTVCGKAKIAKSVVVQSGATLNGSIEVSEGAHIGANSTINGGGKIGRNVIVGKNVTLNGDINLANTQLADGTTLNGDIDIDGVTVTGDMTCSVDGKIRANTPSGTVQ